MSAQWNYPLEETNGNARPPPKRHDTFGSQESGQSGYRDLKSARRPTDAYNVQSDSEGAKQRRASVRASNGSAASRKRSRNTLREKGKEKPKKTVDDSAWIHRDKLAQIEIQEMEEAGIHMRQSRRSLSAGPGASARSSRSQSRTRRPMSKDRPNDQTTEDPYGASYGYEEFEWKRVSTIPAADEDEHDFDATIDTEFRTAEEVAVEHESVRSLSQIRPSTSRIPISKVSPVPVPQNVVDRDSPLPRSRNGSGNWSGNWDEMHYARRARSNSIGSQAILDEDGVRTPSRPASKDMRSSDENSPPKSRIPNKSTPTSGVRKGSTPNGTNRPGSSSHKPRQKSISDRPTSRSGRPSTSHQNAPQGEAPWIASMYKPDPRLPPDQQMLPTHAKRMMQDQWEKEGRAGTAYDREFRPLNDGEFPTQKPRPAAPPSPEKQMFDLESPYQATLSPNLHQLDTSKTNSPNSPNMNAWPLTPKSDNKSDSGSVRPGTSGGYKITPKIATPPPIQKSPTQVPMGSAHNTMPRVPDLDEKNEVQAKKGGCGCCIVM